MIYSRNQEAIENEALHKAIEATGEDAPCANYPDAFYADYREPGGTYIRDIAVSLCAGCPVRQLCADYATRWELVYGIWGGTLPSERRRERNRLIAAGVEMPNLYVENAGRDYQMKPRGVEEEFNDDEVLEGDRFAG